MIMREVATLAEAETVADAVCVLTVSSGLAASASVIAVETHVLGVVNLVCVFAVCYLFLTRSFWHELRQFCFKLK